MSNRGFVALVVLLVAVVMVLLSAYVLLVRPAAPVGQPNVSLLDVTAVLSNCNEDAGTYLLTYTFTLVNSGNRAANVTLGFHVNGNLVAIRQYLAAAGSSQPVSTQLSQGGGCPGLNPAYSIELMVVTPA
jgi:hypothetical protein